MERYLSSSVRTLLLETFGEENRELVERVLFQLEAQELIDISVKRPARAKEEVRPADDPFANFDEEPPLL